MRIRVRYTDGSVNHHETLPKAICETREDICGSDFAVQVQDVYVVDKDDNELTELFCSWSLSISPGSDEENIAFCANCGKPIKKGTYGGGWCDKCRLKYT